MKNTLDVLVVMFTLVFGLSILTLLGIIIVLFLPVLFCLHIVKTRPHSKLGVWLKRNVITDIDLEPVKKEPLEKGLLDDDVLEPPLKG